MGSSIEQIGEDTMNKWLHERYISRAEHQEIVAYYKRLVGQLYGKVRDLRAQADDAPMKKADGGGLLPKERSKAQPQTAVEPIPGGGNVIYFDFRRGL